MKDADTLYAERISRCHSPEHERKREVRDAAVRDAARYERLAALADSVAD